MYGTIWALLPPVVAIVLALITKEVYSSLFIGIVTGALIYTGFSPIATLDTVINEGFINSVADAWNIGIFMFLILLGTMVALMNKAGGSAAFGEWAKKHVKTRAGALLATFLLGVLIFVDDYFNCLTVGSVMMPVTDGHKISRAKLAYIIDATASRIPQVNDHSLPSANRHRRDRRAGIGFSLLELFGDHLIRLIQILVIKASECPVIAPQVLRGHRRCELPVLLTSQTVEHRKERIPALRILGQTAARYAGLEDPAVDVEIVFISPGNSACFRAHRITDLDLIFHSLVIPVLIVERRLVALIIT